MKYTPKFLRGMLLSMIRKIGEHPEQYVRQHGWNLWHMSALFDLENGIYTDLIVQKEHEKNECSALSQMAGRSRVTGKVILLADRNYESCNNLAPPGEAELELPDPYSGQGSGHCIRYASA